MELLDGISLKEHLHQQRQLDLDEVLAIGSQIAMGSTPSTRSVSCMTPAANAMLVADGATPSGCRAVIADFGEATVCRSDTPYPAWRRCGRRNACLHGAGAVEGGRLARPRMSMPLDDSLRAGHGSRAFHGGSTSWRVRRLTGR
jgi:hypothetical protein